MEKLCIDVRGFSEEKKKRVQDAFFKLGIGWPLGGKCHCYLDRGQYTSVHSDGTPDSHLMHGSGKITDAQKSYAITYTQLMQKAGLNESDPDVFQLQPAGDTLRETIEGYFRLLDSIRDPEARQLVKQQLTDLQDLEFKLFNGEDDNA